MTAEQSLTSSKVEFPRRKKRIDTTQKTIQLMIASSRLRKEQRAEQKEARAKITTDLPWVAVFLPEIGISAMKIHDMTF